jgi:hypothetical protein
MCHAVPLQPAQAVPDQGRADPLALPFGRDCQRSEECGPGLTSGNPAEGEKDMADRQTAGFGHQREDAGVFREQLPDQRQQVLLREGRRIQLLDGGHVIGPALTDVDGVHSGLCLLQYR